MWESGGIGRISEGETIMVWDEYYVQDEVGEQSDQTHQEKDIGDWDLGGEIRLIEGLEEAGSNDGP